MKLEREILALQMIRIRRNIKDNNHGECNNQRRQNRIDAIQQRLNLKQRIADTAFESKCYIEESGMDCDGVQYAGHIHRIPATIDAYNDLSDDLSDWADGPFYLRIITPKEAGETRYRSRDRALEAYEDNHPHILYTGAI